jgi:DNA repair photolyase
MISYTKPKGTGETGLNLLLREIRAKGLLSSSRIPDVAYCVNPYVGCEHACRYCYATFISKYTGHTEPWGRFLDVRVNAPELLVKELRKKKRGAIMVSSVTDPYQPSEASYKLTRRCLEIMADAGWPVRLQTKSPLVMRDLDVLKHFEDLEVGITVTTDDEFVRRVMEPHAPPIEERIRALKGLSSAGIKTYAFVGPVLPMNQDRLARMLRGKTQEVVLDRMNYPWKVSWIYSQRGWEDALTDGFYEKVKESFSQVLDRNTEIYSV